MEVAEQMQPAELMAAGLGAAIEEWPAAWSHTERIAEETPVAAA